MYNIIYYKNYESGFVCDTLNRNNLNLFLRKFFKKSVAKYILDELEVDSNYKNALCQIYKITCSQHIRDHNDIIKICNDPNVLYYNGEYICHNCINKRKCITCSCIENYNNKLNDKNICQSCIDDYTHRSGQIDKDLEDNIAKLI